MRQPLSINTIKKSYAADVIEDFQKMDAVELLNKSPIPERRQVEVRHRLDELKKDPSKKEQLKNIERGLKEVQQFKK